jgi:hypothetical protein
MAQAQYTCQEGGNEIPATVTGSATVTETGNCTIGYAVTVSGGDLTITELVNNFETNFLRV